ncbi:hypothetical protein AHMF7605_19765 [Adhaeribacter arboris]|uniref:SH3 domain-containing protein n=1 Tax=Adhaeribacter arboris TaxID=2072846 RepID=A0A2T2YJ89_9BACT|nr:hypothetical protein [Adhaeribacter arboris]PSR55583.1 hypothetical protein AHMF7605_19765 [Adhaeribacter arboris]
MKNIFALILLGLLAASCQSGTEQRSAPENPPTQQLVVVANIEEKLYDRPTVRGLAIAMVQPQEMLQVMDTTDYFFYKVRLKRAPEIKEGYILKAAFVGKPILVRSDSLQAFK